MAVLLPITQWLDNSGNVLAAGKLRTKSAGTSDDQATYIDASESDVNANPLILDSAGRGQLWLASSLNYDIYVYDSNDNLLETISNISGSGITTSFTLTAAADVNMNGFSMKFNDNTGINDSNGNELVKFQLVGSAVNYIDITNASAGNAPTIVAAGSDTNIGLTLDSQGTGVITLAGPVSATSTLGVTGAITASGGVVGNVTGTLTGSCTGSSASVASGTETIGSGAVSTSVGLTRLDITSSGTITLAAPGSTWHGMPKIIRVNSNTGAFTRTLTNTNIQGYPSGTTATFGDVDDYMILMAITQVGKWLYIGSNGVTFS